jgi:hypothetical protein
VLSALGFDAILLGYGANEGASGVPAMAFGDDLRALIQTLRASLGQSIPISLVCDPFQSRLDARYWDSFDRYAGVEYQIAQADPLVMSVNSRRALDDIG